MPLDECLALPGTCWCQRKPFFFFIIQLPCTHITIGWNAQSLGHAVMCEGEGEDDRVSLPNWKQLVWTKPVSHPQPTKKSPESLLFWRKVVNVHCWFKYNLDQFEFGSFRAHLWVQTNEGITFQNRRKARHCLLHNCPQTQDKAWKILRVHLGNNSPVLGFPLGWIRLVSCSAGRPLS